MKMRLTLGILMLTVLSVINVVSLVAKEDWMQKANMPQSDPDLQRVSSMERYSQSGAMLTDSETCLSQPSKCTIRKPIHGNKRLICQRLALTQRPRL